MAAGSIAGLPVRGKTTFITAVGKSLLILMLHMQHQNQETFPILTAAFRMSGIKEGGADGARQGRKRGTALTAPLNVCQPFWSLL